VVQVADGCTVYLAGRLAEAQACELRRVCAEATGPVSLDLTDLVSLDAVGVDMLRRLRDEGAAIVGVAEYLKQKLGPSQHH
jgi:anti-anti-sigma regulatory factor